MRIVHIDLSGTFNEEMTYQENLIAKYNVLDNNMVLVITTCYRWNEDGKIEKAKNSDYITKEGYRVIRLKYKKLINSLITEKIRDIDAQQLKIILNEFRPDIIVLHCFQTYAIRYISDYARINNIKFVIDTHTNFENSAKNVFSYYILHKIIYKQWLEKSYDSIYRIYYIGYMEKDFIRKVYNIGEEKLEYLPLGGEILESNEKNKIRAAVRRKENIKDQEVLFVIAGKFDKKKRLFDVLRVFLKIPIEAKLLIVGAIEEEIKEEINRAIKLDPRVKYVGFKEGKELEEILNAADIYMQPFNLSAIAQNALCAGCALILKECSTYKDMIVDNGYLVTNENDLEKAISKIAKDKGCLENMKQQSILLAKNKYDYSIIARKIIS